MSLALLVGNGVLARLFFAQSVHLSRITKLVPIRLWVERIFGVTWLWFSFGMMQKLTWVELELTDDCFFVSEESLVYRNFTDDALSAGMNLRHEYS